MTGVRPAQPPRPAHPEPTAPTAPAGNPLAVLHRLRTTPVRPQPRPGERCELCTEPVADEHGHLVDLESRALMCACRGCYLLFTAEGAGGRHFRAVPDRYVSFPDVTLSPAEWDDLQIPVSVAFFFVNSVLGRVAAFYPGPAGATESELALDTWQAIVDAHPPLATLVPDVEAVLVRAPRTGPVGTGGARTDDGSGGPPGDAGDADRAHGGRRPGGAGVPAAAGRPDRGRGGVELFVVPIDACYALVGELRRLWRGFDGGSQAHAALDRFFDRVRHEARPA